LRRLPHRGTGLRVFGSVARGEDRPDSDVDLLADLPPGTSLFGLRRVQAESAFCDAIARRLGCHCGPACP